MSSFSDVLCADFDNQIINCLEMKNIANLVLLVFGHWRLAVSRGVFSFLLEGLGDVAFDCSYDYYQICSALQVGKQSKISLMSALAQSLIWRHSFENLLRLSIRNIT